MGPKRGANCTLRDAVLAVTAGGAISVPPGTIQLDDEVLLTQSVTIAGWGSGSGGSELTTTAIGPRILEIAPQGGAPNTEVTISGRLHGATDLEDFGSNGGAIRST